MSTSPMLAQPPVGLSPLKEDDPTDIGLYRLVGRIGAGGMGAVYGALDTYGRCVAVKTVHARFARRPEFREAFAHEVAMLARVDGVGTARLHAHDTEAEVPWLAFDHVPGRDLRAHVREFGPLEGEMLRVFALGMAEGLAALHAAGVVHRDVKPANVILSPDGPKIVDFGIATPIGTERSDDAFADHGTPGWAAPERHAGAIADSAADVFAWGALVAMAATGRQPFGKGETKERIRRVCAGEYEIDGVPEDLLPLVEGALSMEPGERPGAADLVRALLPEERRDEEVGRALRRMLGDYWRGVDAAGHDPARWAAWLGGASATALGATGILGGAVGTGTGGAATGGIAGSSAAASGTTGATASGSSSGGVLGGLAGSKAAMIGAGALAAAGVAAGGFVVYDLVSDSPADLVASAATVVEESAGFTATVERTPVDGGETVTEEYLYSADGESFLIRGAAMGPGTTAVASHQGELYVYASHEEDLGLWQDSPQELWTDGESISLDFGEEGDHGLWRNSSRPLGSDVEMSAEILSPALVTGPLRTLAGSGEVEAVEGRERVYEGSTVLELLEAGELVEREATGRVGLDEEGAPIWVEYMSDGWETRVDFEEIGGGVVLEDPQVWAAENDGFGWAVVRAPICGTVRLPGWAADRDAEKVWDVQASGWDVDCDYAMEVAALREDSSRDPERFEGLHGARGGMGGITQYDGRVACGLFWESVIDDDGFSIPSYAYGPCQESEVLSREDLSEFYTVSEVEFGPVTLIDFHQRA
ncbi:serine/threonine protein kinase [Nocardiopsis alba]|uniref:serine/threonine protein kinase n=1 Tax=Nocardiopsis alba TaxID=53437 RepID=UPI0004779D4A|nr:serine/threonine-protein kinase [Nocardiopsis alba]